MTESVNSKFRSGLFRHTTPELDALLAEHAPGFACRQVLMPSATAHFPHDHWSGVDTKAHREAHAFLVLADRYENATLCLDSNRAPFSFVSDHRVSSSDNHACSI